MAVIANNNQNNEENKDQTSGQPLQTVGTATPAGQKPSGTPTANSMANSLAQQQRQGSGRFTNLQKYIQANKAGGQRIAQQVGSGFNKQFEKEASQAQDYYNKLGQSIQQAQDVAKQGQGFQQQLQGIGQQIKSAALTPEQIADQQVAQQRLAERGQADLSGIEAFTQQPDFNQFQNIQAGRGINENLLALQQQRALSEAGQAADLARQTQAGLGSEAGRFEMLRKTFGKTPGYTTGQQRLDQVLFGQGGGLAGLQGDVTQKARSAVEQGNLAAKAGQDVSRMTEAERGLMTDIDAQAKANEQAYMDMLSSYIDPTNVQRKAEFEDLNRAVQSYRPENQNNYAQGFTEDQMARLGLTDKNQGVYNVFRDHVSSAEDIAQKGREAKTAQDIANEQDVKRYQALAKIMGNKLTSPNITEASKLGASWTSAEGDAALKNRLAAAEQAFRGLDRIQLKAAVPGGTVTGYSSVQDLINKGRQPVSEIYTSGGARVNPGATYASGRGDMYGNFQNALTNQITPTLQNFLNQQNYNRTLGGRRETFLDTERAAKQAALGITPKNIPGEVTGTDPSLQYNNLENLIKGAK